MGGTNSPFKAKNKVKRSPNRPAHLNKKKFDDEEETKVISDREESFKITYDNENMINRGTMSIKSSNTHKVGGFKNRKKKSEKIMNHKGNILIR